MYKLSVIVPIFGVEKYIERCIHSLLQQTLDEIEFIFVDDCSKDKSIHILNETIKKYPKRIKDIKIVRTPFNNGLPQARKYGLQYATGDYIIHCDSDDWVESDMYETLYREAIQHNWDIVSCDYYESTENSDIIFSAKGNTNTPELYLSDIISFNIAVSVWNKLIKRTLYEEKLIHPTQNMGEDLVLIIQLILRSQRIGHINKPLYHYFSNPNSISKEKSENAIIKKWDAINENILLIEKILKSNGIGDKYSKELIALKENSRKHILKPLIYKSKIRKIWIHSFPEINLSPSNSLKNNIVYILIYSRVYLIFVLFIKIAHFIKRLIK